MNPKNIDKSQPVTILSSHLFGEFVGKRGYVQPVPAAAGVGMIKVATDRGETGYFLTKEIKPIKEQ